MKRVALMFGLLLLGTTHPKLAQALFPAEGGSNVAGVKATLGAPILTPYQQTFLTPPISDTNSEKFGASLGYADVNGDGFDDLLVGATSVNFEGHVYIYFGGAFDAMPDVTLTGFKGSGFGISVAGAGDFNGDGIQDVIVGANQAQNLDGRAYVYFGGNPMNNTLDLTLKGEDAAVEQEHFGESVAGVGDVNGDGKDDLVVGAPGHDNSPPQSVNNGAAYVFFGPNDTVYDKKLLMSAPQLSLGASVAAAGKFNIDGYRDIVVGGDYRMNNGNGAGVAAVFYGGPNMSTSPGKVYTGSTGKFFGCSVAGIGKFTGDPDDDIVVGERGIAGGVGRAIMFTGGTNGDFPNGLTLASGPTTNFGASVSAGADLNQDGRTDLLVGAPGTGQVFSYLGGTPPNGAQAGMYTGTVGKFGDVVLGGMKLNSEVRPDFAVSHADSSGLTGVRVYLSRHILIFPLPG